MVSRAYTGGDPRRWARSARSARSRSRSVRSADVSERTAQQVYRPAAALCGLAMRFGELSPPRPPPLGTAACVPICLVSPAGAVPNWHFAAWFFNARPASTRLLPFPFPVGVLTHLGCWQQGGR